jgi:hypothetical protein
MSLSDFVVIDLSGGEMLPMAKILDVVGASSHDIENWIGTLELFSKFQPTVRGRARLYSRDNVLELALLAAFVKAGVRPSLAAAHAAQQLRSVRHSGRVVREWTAFAVGNPDKAIGVQQLDDEVIKSLLKDGRAAAVSILAIGEIKRRVDALFERD